MFEQIINEALFELLITEWLYLEITMLGFIDPN